eukprot:scaffold9948_cov129-Cylindrotheca_fusiformis.AAC.20
MQSVVKRLSLLVRPVLSPCASHCQRSNHGRKASCIQDTKSTIRKGFFSRFVPRKIQLTRCVSKSLRNSTNFHKSQQRYRNK